MTVSGKIKTIDIKIEQKKAQKLNCQTKTKLDRQTVNISDLSSENFAK